MKTVKLNFKQINVEPWPYEEKYMFRCLSKTDLSGEYVPAADVRKLVEAVRKFIEPIPMELTGFSRVRKDKELAELKTALDRIGEVEG